MMLQGGRHIGRISQINAQTVAGRHALPIRPLERVPALFNSSSVLSEQQDTVSYSTSSFTQHRKYATQPVSRPKAHTGRTAASTRKTATTSETKAAKKPVVKKTSAKRPPGAGAAAKAAAKPKKVKKKAKSKVKPKPKPKRKVLTDLQKKEKAGKDRRDMIRATKKATLTVPKTLPITAWTVFTSRQLKQNLSGAAALGGRMKELSAQYKNLEPEQLEEYNHLANQNKAANAAAYKDFINSHSAVEIHNANAARARLNLFAARTAAPRSGKPYPLLHDDRQPKKAGTSYSFFVRDRSATGDFNGMNIATRSNLTAREWKSLSDAEKKVYKDKADAELSRFYAERKATLGIEPPKTRSVRA